MLTELSNHDDMITPDRIDQITSTSARRRSPFGLVSMKKLQTFALLIEDDMDLSETIADYLACEGIDCEIAFSGIAGLAQAASQEHDVILLDVMVPGMDGLEVCRRLRSQGVDRPILMITARDALAEKIEGFDAGADDYLVKPFALQELVARVFALKGRKSSQTKILHVDDLLIDRVKHVAKRGNRKLRLSPTSWIILEKLALAAPAVVGRAELERSIWGEDCPSSDCLKYHIHKLRFQLDRPYERPLLRTVAKSGFALRADE